MPPKFAVIRRHHQNPKAFAVLTFDVEEEGLTTERLLTEAVTPAHSPFATILQAMEIAWRVEECQRVLIGRDCLPEADTEDYQPYLVAEDGIIGIPGLDEETVVEPTPQAYTCRPCGSLVAPAAAAGHNRWHADLQQLLQYLDGFNTKHEERIAQLNMDRIS